MSATAGKKTRVKVSTTAGGAGTYTTALGIKNVSIELDGEMVDVSSFGSDWKEKLQGLKDSKITMGGNYEPGDTTGQGALRSAWLNDTEAWIQVLVDGTLGFKVQIKVAKFGVDSEVSDKVGVSIDAEGTGVVSII
jgi:predicted secreted protein